MLHSTDPCVADVVPPDSTLKDVFELVDTFKRAAHILNDDKRDSLKAVNNVVTKSGKNGKSGKARSGWRLDE